jgi:hypothetical protein
MSRFLLRGLLVLTILTPALAPAELVLYKGTRRDTYTGESHALTVTWKMILVVDHDTAQAARVQYATINGVRRYATSQWTNTHFVQVTGARGGYTVIARSLTQCEMDCGLTGEGVYCKGANATLMLNTNSTAFFPKIFSDHGNGLSYSHTSGQPVVNEGSFQVVFDRPATLASNQAQETFATAFARFVAYVESLGYTP